MGKVFISYSRRDTEVVKQIVAQLEAAGIQVWFDTEDIKAGKQWRKQIVEGIDTADAFILHMSPDSMASENVMKEVNLAEDAQQRFILPIMVKETKISDEMRYQLAGTQFIAYYLDPKKGVKDLIAEIKKRQNVTESNPVQPTGFREVEVVLENQTKESFGAQAKQKLLETLGEIIHGSIVDVSQNYMVTRVEEIIK